MNVTDLIGLSARRMKIINFRAPADSGKAPDADETLPGPEAKMDTIDGGTQSARSVRRGGQHLVATTQIDVNELICDGKLSETPLGGDVTVGQGSARRDTAVRVIKREM